MRLPIVPGAYTPRIEQQRNNAIERESRQAIKKYGENVIEGSLAVEGDTTVANLTASGTLNVTGTFQLGGTDIAQAAAQSDSTATDVAGLVSDFNALLAKLRTAGLLDT